MWCLTCPPGGDYCVSMTKMCLLAALIVAPVLAQSTINLTDGTSVNGEVQGTILFAAKDRPSYAVVFGKTIRSVNRADAKLEAASIVIQTGLPLTTSPNLYRSIKLGDILRSILPVAEKMEAVKDVSTSTVMAAALSGDADEPGAKMVAVGGARAYIMKRLIDGPGAYPIAGEIQKVGVDYNLIPKIRILTASGLVSVDVGKIEVPEEKK